MDFQLRELVRSRAGDRCEYCHLRQTHLPVARLQLEHVRAKKHGGGDDAENLAWACVRCNLGKGVNLSGVDDVSNEVVRLYNPRTDAWEEHFRFTGPFLEGLTPCGRATVAVLNMNEELRIQLRQELIDTGQWD
jgi:hypothetical protein